MLRREWLQSALGIAVGATTVGDAVMEAGVTPCKPKRHPDDLVIQSPHQKLVLPGEWKSNSMPLTECWGPMFNRFQIIQITHTNKHCPEEDFRDWIIGFSGPEGTNRVREFFIHSSGVMNLMKLPLVINGQSCWLTDFSTDYHIDDTSLHLYTTKFRFV
jgi:hypothetical protein